MGEFEKNMIERGKRALKGGYSIALGRQETEILIEGLQEVKRRYHITSGISDAWLNADVMELLARRCLRDERTMQLRKTGIKQMIKAVKLRERRRQKLIRKQKRA